MILGWAWRFVQCEAMSSDCVTPHNAFVNGKILDSIIGCGIFCAFGFFPSFFEKYGHWPNSTYREEIPILPNSSSRMERADSVISMLRAHIIFIFFFKMVMELWLSICGASQWSQASFPALTTRPDIVSRSVRQYHHQDMLTK